MPVLAVIGALAALGAGPPRQVQAAGVPTGGQRSPARVAVIAFLSSPRTGGSALRLLAGDRHVGALGLIVPSQGAYDERQAILDLTQGAWISDAGYRPRMPPRLLVAGDGRVVHWPAILARAAGASAEIEPGLLAGTIPGGAAYGAGEGPLGSEAAVAAGRDGRIAQLSRGPVGTLAERISGLLGRFRLVVAGAADIGTVDRLLAARTPNELVLVLERPPPVGRVTGARVLAIGASGIPGNGGTLRSRTTRRPGLVTALDVAPTVLDWLGTRSPAAIRGAAFTRGGERDVARLERFDARLGVLAGRRWPAIDAFLLAWLALLVVGCVVRGRRGLRLGLRLGGLTALWTPCTVLLAAALEPSRYAELVIIVGGGFVLAAITDRLVPWPRGPAVPGAAMVVAYAFDLALGSPLISLSLLGPNPLAGSRFFGIGNELEAALPIVLFAGLAAGLPQRRPGRREAVLYAAAGLTFTGLIASGRLGADVGAVFTIGGGTSFAVLALRGRLGRRAIALACAAPLLGLVLLAGLDLATGAGGHFTGTVLHAGSFSDVANTFSRKLDSAARQLRRGVMPVNAALCLLAAGYSIRHPNRVLEPLVGEATAWRGCLIGGFAAGVLGSLANDSGPVLLVIATFGLGCVIAYVRGGPRMPAGDRG